MYNLKRNMKKGVLFLIFICYTAVMYGQVIRSYVVEVSASVNENDPSITLNWPLLADSTGIAVYRRTIESEGRDTWGAPIDYLSGDAITFTDPDILAGTIYEYRLISSGSPSSAGDRVYGYITAAVKAGPVEKRGKVILLVEKKAAAALPEALERYTFDLIGDGWEVLRHHISSQAGVEEVKGVILAEYQKDPQNVKSVLLFGHIPVPFSGYIKPDGHEQRPFPADGYYGDMDGLWTDEIDKGTNNSAGDGKFDNDFFPGKVELEVGRVDMDNLPAMRGRSEMDMLGNYIEKAHAFRHKEFTVPERALVDDNWGLHHGVQRYSAGAYNSFSTFFGPENVADKYWYSAVQEEEYLWAYGSGSGGYYGVGGLRGDEPFPFTPQPGDYTDLWRYTTSDVAFTESKVVFSLLFGSYMGELHAKDNILRAMIGSDTYTLSCAWSGSPVWYLHHMALGKTLGYSTRRTQNGKDDYDYYSTIGTNNVHTALVGDPTLRMHTVYPPADLTCRSEGDSVLLNWSASFESGIEGYTVYRSASKYGPYEKLSDFPVNALIFTDNTPLSGDNHYMVRTVKLKSSASGSYYNMSQGIFTTFDSDQPVLTLSSPVENALYTEGDTIVLAAHVEGVANKVTGVRFFENGNLIGEVHSGIMGGFFFQWEGAAAGSYTLTAEAVYENTSVQASEEINVRVKVRDIIIDIEPPAALQINSDNTISVNFSIASGGYVRLQTMGTNWSGWKQTNHEVNAGGNQTIDFTHTAGNITADSAIIQVYLFDGSMNELDRKNISIPVGSVPAPSITITSPAPGAVFTEGSTITVTAGISNINVPVTSVSFYNNQVLIGEVFNGTDDVYSFDWTGAAPGSHSLTARVDYDGGSVQTAQSVPVTVNQAGQTNELIEIDKPEVLPARGEFSLTVTFSSTVAGYIRVQTMGTDWKAWQQSNHEISAGENQTVTVTHTTNGISTDSAHLQVYLLDSSTNRLDGEKVQVPVGSVPAPSITITSPAPGAVFTEGSTITVTAGISNINVPVTSVSFYDNQVLIGEVFNGTDGVYSFDWTGAAPGSYSLTARVDYDGGSVQTAQPVPVTVNQAGQTNELIEIDKPEVLPARGEFSLTVTFSSTVAGYIRVQTMGTDWKAWQQSNHEISAGENQTVTVTHTTNGISTDSAHLQVYLLDSSTNRLDGEKVQVPVESTLD